MSKRELIDSGIDKRYVRGVRGGRIDESDDLWRSFGQDRQLEANKPCQPANGDLGA